MGGWGGKKNEDWVEKKINGGRKIKRGVDKMNREIVELNRRGVGVVAKQCGV